jgi:hypothetical protein
MTPVVPEKRKAKKTGHWPCPTLAASLVSSIFHALDLAPRPRVQVDALYFRDVNAKAPVHPSADEADEDAKVPGRPCRAWKEVGKPIKFLGVGCSQWSRAQTRPHKGRPVQTPLQNVPVVPCWPQSKHFLLGPSMVICFRRKSSSCWSSEFSF